MSAQCFCCSPTRRLLISGAVALPALAACGRAPDIELVPDEMVRELGLQTWGQIRQNTPATRNADRQRLAQLVGERLLTAAGEAPGDWEIVVFGSADVNAFALPGNKIGVFEGMFDVIGSEDQLAAIVGHEIGHLKEDHSQQRLTAQVAKEAGVGLITVLLQAGDVGMAREIGAALGIGAEFGLLRPYSRNHELEADRYGLRLMHQAGYEAAEAVQLWRRMQEAAGGRAPAFLSTHPAPERRIREIEAMLPELERLAPAPS
jgi:predicted Zn-dependent protease